MKKRVAQYIVLSLLTLAGGALSLVAGQYYYFDSGTTTYPYQQGCNEQIDIKATTAGNITGAAAGLFSVKFDTNRFSYFTGNTVSDLQIYLFVADTSIFPDYTNPLLYPQWIDSGAKTTLHIDRFRNGSNFIGTGRYGTLYFVPKYDTANYTGTFTIVYNGDTVKTSLSYGGINIINPSYQYAHLTGYFNVVQQPCVNDATAPAFAMPYPINGMNKQSYLSGISLSFNENAGNVDVPYVRSGGLPGIGTRTANTWGINNQYGVNLSTFEIWISGNGTGRYFTGGQFTNGGLLSAVPNGITRQSRDKNYNILIDPSQLFDYGIEKPMVITGRVYDRNNNLTTFTRTFNPGYGPTLIPGSANPADGAGGILGTPSVVLGIQDEWAGVNSGSIKVTLSGVNGTNYGPYIFSGSDLNLSGVGGIANEPDYYVTISGQAAFPSSGTIKLIVEAYDMEGTIDTISDYIFTTKPSCVDLGCCQNVYLQTGRITPPFFYTGYVLTISGGINPSFTGNGNTGTLYCGTEGVIGMNIYKGSEVNSGSATHITYFDLPNLVLSGTSVKATLSGMTLVLERIYIPPITGGCIGTCGGGGGGGGGGILTPDDCKLPSVFVCANTEGIDNSPSYYDQTCCAPSTGEHGAAPSCNVSDSLYNQEITDAFSRGYNLNITNKCPISTARLDDNIIRKELAKMMTMFTIQIIGLYPDTHKEGCDKFSDTKYLSDEMKFYTKTACQLNLMGLKPDGKTPDKFFNPNSRVPRSEFGTVLSRLIYGDQYNIYSGEEMTYKRYEKHLKALNRDNVMKRIKDPLMLEERARVLLMLYRTNSQHLVEQYRLVAPAHNGTISLLENVR